MANSRQTEHEPPPSFVPGIRPRAGAGSQQFSAPLVRPSRRGWQRVVGVADPVRRGLSRGFSMLGSEPAAV